MSIKRIISLVFISLFIVGTGCSSQYVDPGNVAVKVNLYGSDRGVDEDKADIVDPGRVWYNPYYVAYYEFPTFVQNAQWYKGSNVDESISFNSIEGSLVNVDMGISYSFERDKVPHIFKKFRQDADKITHGYLRNKVRDAMNEHASTMKITDIFGAKKHELLEKVTKDIKDELEPEGFNIDTLSFITAFRVDSNVEQSIVGTIVAAQKSIEAENKVKQIKAEADQAIEKARGESESSLLKAESEAKAILLKAKANAEANTELAKSLTPELVKYQALQRWDGILPKFSGSGSVIPFINVDKE